MTNNGRGLNFAYVNSEMAGSFQNGVSSFQDLDIAIPSDDENAANGYDSD